MCGIGLVVSGIELATSTSCSSSPTVVDSPFLIGDHLIEALKNRGPDNVGQCKLSVRHEHVAGQKYTSTQTGGVLDCTTLHFMGTVLQLRGTAPISQPLKDPLNNILLFNGEVFGGLHVELEENDAQVLLNSLSKCCSCACHTRTLPMHVCNCTRMAPSETSHTSVPELLSCIRGPWALIYWQAASKSLWFGRDALGRRSLLVHWPSQEDPQLVLSSVATSICRPAEETHDVFHMFDYWQELPCGMYSTCINSVKGFEQETQQVDNTRVWRLDEHSWKDPTLVMLVAWERRSVNPKARSDKASMSPNVEPCLCVLTALKESVKRRTSNITRHQQWLGEVGAGASLDSGTADLNSETLVAILFSGGLDSMILAALADQCLPSQCTIDLLNVSFEGEKAPDRVSAIAGLDELSTISPSRRWRLVEVDGSVTDLDKQQNHLLSLICPSKTHMDLNIGTALWLAASGCGWVRDGVSRKLYKSGAQVILVGTGADEQCAGYGRHRTKFREGGWEALDKEMKIDMQRLWKRNLGRDDRCIADHGKEARFPFLDEDVIQALLDVPLWEIADLTQPLGKDCHLSWPSVGCNFAKASNPVWKPHCSRFKSKKLW